MWVTFFLAAEESWEMACRPLLRVDLHEFGRSRLEEFCDAPNRHERDVLSGLDFLEVSPARPAMLFCLFERPSPFHAQLSDASADPLQEALA